MLRANRKAVSCALVRPWAIHGLAVRSLKVVLDIDNGAGDAHPAVSEVGDRTQDHECVRIHVDIGAPFLRLFGEPTGQH